MEFRRNVRTDAQGNMLNKKKKRWFVPVIVVTGLIFIVGGFFLWKTGSLVSKISSNGNLFSSLAHIVPGVEEQLKGEKEGRINILLLGMRGENVPGGGTLADTIMVLSVKPDQNKAAFLSVPRDLYVDNPNVGHKTKINAVYAYGQQDGKNKGMESMKEVVGNIVGQEIHYAVVINFKGFTDLVNAVGGVEVTLEKPFEEALQFNEEKVCDAYTFTKPTGKYEYKYHTRKDGSKYVAATYKLCTNPNVECGGDFKLPAGTQTLDGNKALCYARARKTTSDFDRAKRQQIIIQKIKDKAISMGTLTDFEKVNSMMGALGENLKTDMELWEMKKIYELEQKMQNPEIIQKVLDASEEGLLYFPPSTPETGSILAPIGDNYDRIKKMFAEIFPVNQDSQSQELSK